MEDTQVGVQAPVEPVVETVVESQDVPITSTEVANELPVDPQDSVQCESCQ